MTHNDCEECGEAYYMVIVEGKKLCGNCARKLAERYKEAQKKLI